MATRWIRKGNKLELVEIAWNTMLLTPTQDPSEAWVEIKTLYTIEYSKKLNRYIARDNQGNIISKRVYEGKTTESLNYAKYSVIVDIMNWLETEDIPQN